MTVKDFLDLYRADDNETFDFIYLESEQSGALIWADDFSFISEKILNAPVVRWYKSSFCAYYPERNSQICIVFEEPGIGAY